MKTPHTGKKIPETIRELFGIETASESKSLQDKANTFVRNGLIAVTKDSEGKVQRQTTYLNEGQDTVLFNALLLSAFFHDTKYVKDIFENKKTREAAAGFIKSIFTERSTICGIALSSSSTFTFIQMLEDGSDLYKNKLPNPLEQLPQQVLGTDTNLMLILLAQAAVLDPVDSVLAAYVEGDIERAAQLADQLANPEPVQPLLDMIRKQNANLQEFSSFLDDFLK